MLEALGQASHGTHSSSPPFRELSELESYHRQTKAGAACCWAKLWFQQGTKQSLQLTDAAAPYTLVNVPGTSLSASTALLRYMFLLS